MLGVGIPERKLGRWGEVCPRLECWYRPSESKAGGMIVATGSRGVEMVMEAGRLFLWGRGPKDGMGRDD